MKKIKGALLGMFMLVIAIGMSLGGCATVEPKAPEVVCPQMEGYTMEDNQKLLAELVKLETLMRDSTMVPIVILHYSQLRDRLRAVGCRPAPRLAPEPDVKKNP